MSAAMNENPRVLLLDFWSDKNRGDAAMQIALVEMVRRRLPGSSISVMAAYGSNQWPAFVDELDQTAHRVDDVVGGIRPTFVPFEEGIAPSRGRRRAAGLLWTVVGACLLPLWWLIGRFRLLDPLMPAPLRRSVGVLRAADLVVWNGRNFRSNSARREPYEIWHLLYNPLVALLFGKPVACIGASVWPLQHPLSRALFRLVVGRTFFTSFREQSSFDYAGQLLAGATCRVELLPDLSLVALPDERDGGRPQAERGVLRRLGLTVVDWEGNGVGAQNRYRSALLDYLEAFLMGAGTEVVLIPQVTYAMEATGSLEHAILERLGPDRVSVLTGDPTVPELTSVYAGVDLLLATRMHSAIFALSQGTPVVTIPYDRGGKWGILDMMGAPDTDVAYETVTAGALRDKVEVAWERRSATADSVRAALPRLKTAVWSNIDIPISMFLAGTDGSDDLVAAAHG